MERLNRESYFEAGLALLAEGGSKDVTIANLCDRLGITKGSFYHHFASGPEFMRQLLLYWEEEYAQRLVMKALTVKDPVERFETMKLMAVNLQHEAESAIRALARTDPFADEIRRRVDAEREESVAMTLREAGMPARPARRLGRMGVAILVGQQQMGLPVDRRRLRELLDDYQRFLEMELAAPLSLRHRPVA